MLEKTRFQDYFLITCFLVGVIVNYCFSFQWYSRNYKLSVKLTLRLDSGEYNIMHKEIF